MLNDYTNKNNFKFLTSVKSEEYLSLVKYSKGLIGNSSSGLIEVPSLNVPTINIGDRQKGRVRGKSVIDVRANKGEIDKAIKTILAKEYRSKLKDMRNPYYQENSLEKAYQIIKEFLNSQNIKKLKELYEVDLIVKQDQKIKKGKSRIEITKKYTDFLEQNEKVKIKK